MLHPPTNFAVYLLIIFCAPLPTDKQTNITWEITSSAEVKNMKTTRGKQESGSNLCVRSFSCLGVVESPRCSTEIERDILSRWGWVQTLFSSHFVWSTLRLWVTTAAVCSASTPDRICVFFFFFFFFYSNHSHSVGKNTGATNNINDSSSYLNARRIWQPA